MKLYSIGDTAKIMGVSVQALRYYDKIKLLEPKYISPSTGYRYYTYDQFHYIDRIKYLQNFGFTLDEIRSIILTNNINKLVSMLDDKKQALNEEIKKIQQRKVLGEGMVYDMVREAGTIRRSSLFHRRYSFFHLPVFLRYKCGDSLSG